MKFVNFGALTAFFFVNVSVVSHYYAKERRRSVSGTLLYLILPTLGAGIVGWLFLLLSKDALMMGLAWLLTGIVYNARNTAFAKGLLARNKLQARRDA